MNVSLCYYRSYLEASCLIQRTCTDNISNKMALKAAGGAAGFPLTIATLQLGVGMIYALFLWAA